MTTSFLTSFSEEEFKDFLKTTIREVLSEELKRLQTKQTTPLGIGEAARFLKLKITTLYEKTSKKLIPHSKQGNRLYFIQEDLEEWLKKGKVKTSAEIESQAQSYLLNGRNHKIKKQ